MQQFQRKLVLPAASVNGHAYEINPGPIDSKANCVRAAVSGVP